MAKKKAKKAIRPYKMAGRFGILNHMGQLWSCETFWSESQAQKYIDCFQHNHKNYDLRRHRVVPVTLTIEAAKAHSR